MKKILLIMLCAVLLMGISPAISSAQIVKPLCGGPTVTFTFGDISITTPQHNSSSPACVDCKDRIVIAGIPEGAFVTGKAYITEVFTHVQIACETAVPLGTCAGTRWFGSRNVLNVIPLNCAPGAGGSCTFDIEYPPVSDRHSPELHVDMQITVFYDDNGNGEYDQWGSPPDRTLVGPNFGGTGGWDPHCITTGCTPGYWKSHDFPSGIDPNALVNNVFGITNTVIMKKGQAGVPTLTLLQALNLIGGGENAMLRHAVAAYLNATDPGTMIDWCWNKSFPADCYIGGCAFCGGGFSFFPGGVRTKVQSAYNGSSDFETVKNQLEAANETYCVLDSTPRWFGPCCTNFEQFCPWWESIAVPSDGCSP